MKDIHIGTSGYSYDDWVGKFYPQGLPRDQWLSFYATKFDTVELNVTFYRTPNQKAFEGWYKKTPKDFHFVIKGSRFITHLKRLKVGQESIHVFFDAAAHLKEKLKVVLWQLPPKFPRDVWLLERFLAEVEQVSSLTARASQKEDHGKPKIRNAFEFRDGSWFKDDVYTVLRHHNAALVFSDHPFDITEPTTADFIYIRRHGPGGKYHIAYPNRDLKKDTSLIRKYKLPAYEFFNNDARAVGAKNALELKELLEK